MAEGMKFDSGKPRWDLLPIEPTEEEVLVLTHGASKYGDKNWQLVPNPEDRYYAAMMRHICAYRKGEMCDPESGRMHLAHVRCCASFLMHFDFKKKRATIKISAAVMSAAGKMGKLKKLESVMNGLTKNSKPAILTMKTKTNTKSQKRP